MHFFIHNSFHKGDVILSRPIIKALRNKFKEDLITLECREDCAYLWQDLNLPVKIYEGSDHTKTEKTINCPCDALFINIWFGLYNDMLYKYHLSYENNVNSFNRQISKYGLDKSYELLLPEYPPSISFNTTKDINIKIEENSILVENGFTLSGYNSYNLNKYLKSLADEFKEFIFYCSYKPLCKAENIVDISHLDLIQLSSVSSRCMGFVTKGSGINAASHTEENRFKMRCIAGMSYPWRIWEDLRNPDTKADNIDDVRRFLSILSDRLENKNFLIKKGDVMLSKMCKFLKNKKEIDECTGYLKSHGYCPHALECKNWEIAHVINNLTDGNLLDMGSTDSYILKNAAIKKLQGNKYGIDLRMPNVAVKGVKYIVGDLMDVPLKDGLFDNITCLSVIEHEVNFPEFAAECSRLLKEKGKLYVSFDYLEPKINIEYSLYGRKWQPLDSEKVKLLIDVCNKNNLKLIEDIDWSIGENVIRPGFFSPHPEISYTFGMLVFEKCGTG